MAGKPFAQRQPQVRAYKRLLRIARYGSHTRKVALRRLGHLPPTQALAQLRSAVPR